MYRPLTYRDDAGALKCQATRAEMMERLDKLETFVWACEEVDVMRGRVTSSARIMQMSHMSGNPSVTGSMGAILDKHRQQYAEARRKVRRKFDQLTGREVKV